MWNTLWRLGFHPQFADATLLPSSKPGAVLFAQMDDPADGATVGALQRWADGGGTLVVAGEPGTCGSIVANDGTWQRVAVEHPYAGLAYVDAGKRPSLMAPTTWSFARVSPPNDGIRHVGNVATVGG